MLKILEKVLAKVLKHKVNIYLADHSNCPLVRIGTPRPSPESKCVPQNQRGGHPRLRVRGWGGPNSDVWRISLALCLLCGLKHDGVKNIHLDQRSETITLSSAFCVELGTFSALLSKKNY